MNVFKKIILSITNSKRVRKQVNPYLNYVKEELSSFLLIEFDIPKQVEYNISLLVESQPQKY